MIAVMAAEEGREVVTGDIPGAYLHADMRGEVFIVLPIEIATILADMDERYKEFVEGNGKITVKLLKALYGCVESAKRWYEDLKGKL